MAISVRTNTRPLWPAIRNGMACKCPNCGTGKLFRAYLKTHDACSECGEELHHHRADDLPPYLVIVIVGHILVGAMMHLEMAWQVHPMTYLMWLIPLAIVLPLAMLPYVKGGVVGLQWAQRMHGFSAESDAASTR